MCKLIVNEEIVPIPSDVELFTFKWTDLLVSHVIDLKLLFCVSTSQEKTQVVCF